MRVARPKHSPSKTQPWLVGLPSQQLIARSMPHVLTNGILSSDGTTGRRGRYAGQLQRGLQNPLQRNGCT